MQIPQKIQNQTKFEALFSKQFYHPMHNNVINPITWTIRMILFVSIWLVNNVSSIGIPVVYFCKHFTRIFVVFI